MNSAFRRFFLILVIACIGSTASAEQATPGLGRLFFTPAQRTALEAHRAPLPTVVDNKPPLPENDPVHLDGIVLRSSGKTTIWLNGQPQADDQPGAVHPTPPQMPDRIELPVTATKTVELKVGRTLDRITHTATDPLADGEIRIERHFPASTR